jgi:hypothetical protein
LESLDGILRSGVMNRNGSTSRISPLKRTVNSRKPPWPLEFNTVEGKYGLYPKTHENGIPIDPRRYEPKPQLALKPAAKSADMVAA